ncbi:helix-turn-helix transcriptional regulator [Baekduia soli]|uniref:helix-turn-helix transcriptional regulator n=1 Tax=Baekduia soli TaxID=496014 RepID=UPI0016526CA2|nr:LuxR C-terminal-related transcriptional regulator [Baekduia soli]
MAVIEEDDLLRYGLVGCLNEDQRLEVMVATPETLERHEADIAIVSSSVAREHLFACPIIIYGDIAHAATTAGHNDIAGALHRSSLTIAQLHATVHAAAAGLRVNSHANGHAPPVDSREIRLLELIADGCSTREIAEQMSYSERTIKKLITGLEDRLDARSRPQIVAQAIRRGLI